MTDPVTPKDDDAAKRQRSRVDDLLALAPSTASGHITLADGRALDYELGASFLPVPAVGLDSAPPDAAVMATHYVLKGAAAADIILPAAAYTEKNGTYVNNEGRVQRSLKAVFAPGDAREDWSIFRALADVLGVSVGFNSFDECRAAMIAAVPALAHEGIAPMAWNPPKLADKAEGVMESYPIKDFYLTNAIARASQTMQRCSAELLHGEEMMEAAQ